MLTSPDAAGAKAYLDQPRAGRLNIQYAPADGDVSAENPPRFTWLPVVEDEARYAVRVSKDSGYPADSTQLFTGVPLNFFTPDTVFKPGSYHWSYAVWDSEAGSPATEWSVSRNFEILPGLPETPVPGRENRYNGVNLARPRLWLGPEQLAAFKKDVAADPEHCAWSAFYEKSVKPWMKRPVMDEPAPYPDDKRVASVWRRTYIDCQELIYAIRHLSIGGHVTGDSAMLARAKEWLLAAASWNPAGTTSRAYTDEWAFRVTDALAWGYDWLHGELSGDERRKVRAALLVRTREIADHIIKKANIHLFPYDSHAVRAVSSVLVPAGVAMLDEEPEAREWLDYSIEFLSTVYSPWGDRDGGWAEGPHYWMTGMACLIEAAAPAGDDRLRWFKGVGWAAIQHRMDDPKEHIQFVFKSSPFGSVSHSHGDQNAFCLSAFGEDLAIQSGHYVAFNSSMHQDWRRQTRSKNAVLINGKGQYAGRDKALQMKSTGRILAAEERDGCIYIKGDATAAYALVSPEVTGAVREVYFFNSSFFVFVDSVDADEPVEISWLLHAGRPFHLARSSFRNTGEKAGFYGEIIWSEGGAPELSQETGFPGVDMNEIEGLPVSTFMTARFPKAKRHRIVTLLVPYPEDIPRRVFHFIDDQGYDADIYLTDADENTFKVVVKKLAGANV